METPVFKNIVEIVTFALENLSADLISEFIENKNDELNVDEKVPKNELSKTIEITVKAAKNKEESPEKYEKLFKETVDANTTQKITCVKEFVKLHMLHKNIDEIEAFVLEVVKNYLGLKQAEVNNIIKGVKAEKKALKNSEKTLALLNASDPELDIDSEFKGLYSINVSSSGKMSVVPHIDEIATRIIENKYVIMYNGNIFCYDDGYYKNNPYSVKAETIRVLNGICKGSRSNGIKKHLEDVLTVIKNTQPVHAYPFNKHNNAIPCKNGVVVIDFETNTVTLEKHDPEVWKFNYILPIKYNAEENSNVIIEELKKYTQDYKMLVQAIAQALLQAMGYGPYKKAYLLKGKKNCGKTTFLDIVERIIGENNKSKVALSELTPQYRFTRAELEGKLVNLDDDLGYFKMSETGVFKKLTGGYSQKIEKKGLDAYDVNMTNVHMFTTNTPAGFDNRIYVDEAFWERWAYIEFDHTFEKDDDFKQRILTEGNIAGFFNEIVKMIIEIKQKKQLPYVQKWTEVREKWTQESNILYKFIEENMVYGGRTAIIKDDLMHAVDEFCQHRKVDVSLIPEDVTVMGELVQTCGGARDARSNFIEADGTTSKSRHCFILNYTWKPASEYKRHARIEERVFRSDAEIRKMQLNKSTNDYCEQNLCA